jgi:MoaA/NifB/PqqE/SkfB family radical SAM enzyme
MRTRFKSAVIDPVSTCPIRCKFCSVGQNKPMKQEIMNFSLYKEQLEKVKEFGITRLTFGNWSEPLLHPQIVDMIKLSKKLGFRVRLSTSFSVKHDLESLANSGLDILNVSISGFTEDVYNTIHTNGDFDLVLSNLEKFVESNKSRTGIQVAWHRYKHNEHQTEDVRNFCKSLGLVFLPYCGYFGGIDSFYKQLKGSFDKATKDLIKESVFFDSMKSSCKKFKKANNCKQPELLILEPSGRLLHCCALYDFNYSINFLESDVVEIIKFKNSKNIYCNTCIMMGWCGYMHSLKGLERDFE